MEKNKDEIFSLDEEINKRINIMENKEYSFSKRFSRNDYMVTLVTVLLCIIIIIIGIYL